jgi:hypothetical protein
MQLRTSSKLVSLAPDASRFTLKIACEQIVLLGIPLRGRLLWQHGAAHAILVLHWPTHGHARCLDKLARKRHGDATIFQKGFHETAQALKVLAGVHLRLQK